MRNSISSRESEKLRETGWTAEREEFSNRSRPRGLCAAVARGDAPAFPAFERWAKKTRERPAPKYPLEPREKKKTRSKKGEGEGDLAALILARRDARAAQAEDLFASLEAKYGGKKAGTTKAKGGVEKKTKKKMNR